MISIVAAIGENRELGKDNKLLWHIPEDLEHFRSITKNHVIIMGRKTFESIGRVLPNRTNIIITRDISYNVDGAIVVHSLEEGLDAAKNVITRSKTTKQSQLGLPREQSSLAMTEDDEIFIIGGGQIFAEALPLVDRLYLTIVHSSFDADTFFPEYSEFTNIISTEDHESSGYNYSYRILEK